MSKRKSYLLPAVGEGERNRLSPLLAEYSRHMEITVIKMIKIVAKNRKAADP